MPSPRTFVRALAAAAATVSLLAPASAGATTLPTDFHEDTVFSGLSSPTAVRFAKFPDTRIFVAEKAGTVKVFDSVTDTTPTTVANLGTSVNSYSGRGLLGMAVDPSFPTRPYVYVLYTYDAAIGGTAPRWSDACASPSSTCPVSGRLSRLTLNTTTNTMTSESVLINDWCQQYPEHSMGDLAFGADGQLYVTAGDGASESFTDYGQGGNPKNPCGDPGGTNPSPPSAQGGALRSQDVRTTSDPVGLGGALLRLNPDTGAASSGNPSSSSDANNKRIVGYGLRQPHRMAFRPGTSDLFFVDSGWQEREEISRLDSLSSVRNFGWPCYEGTTRQDSYNAANLTLCEDLYDDGGHTSSYYQYSHDTSVVSGDPCPENTEMINSLTFYGTGPFPDSYDGALFFADAFRGCIWAMHQGTNGLPNTGNITLLASGLPLLADLQTGPDGSLFYTDILGGSIKRIHFNRPPTAAASATPTSGVTPLQVSFSGTSSSDPDSGDTLTYAWDLDGDGSYDDSTSATPSWTYNSAGNVTARLRVTDRYGLTDTDSLTISPTAPTPPSNSALPTISGTLRDGETLTSTNGTWSGTPTITFTRQWRRCDSAGANCADIASATGTSYTLTSTDIGKTIRVVVTADNAAPGTVAATSNQTGVIDAIAPSNGTLPSISGTTTDGQTLTSTTGTWTGSPTITFARQWQRCDSAGANCANIGSAFGTTYVLTPTDVGKTIRVVVTADNAAAGTVSATSAQTAVIAPAPPANTALPAISGTTTDGQTLSSTTGTWTGSPTITFARQWQRCDSAGANCVDVGSASGTTYALTPTDVGKTIRVVVTADNAATGTVSATSAQTAAIAATPPVVTALPVISGDVHDGETLSSTTGSWTGTPTITFSRQWRRCDSAGANCADISSATGTTYSPTADDVGKTIRVRVTADNAAAGTVFADSAATALIEANPPANTVLPAVSGTAIDGGTLSSTTGTWTGTAPITFVRQWVRCDAAGGSCSDVSGAAGTTLNLSASDVGSTFRVRVTADNSLPGNVQSTSAPSAVVGAAPPVNTALPTVSGTPRDGETLSSTLGTFTGTPSITQTRQWVRCDSAGANCSDIPGAGGATLGLTPADVGKTIRLRVIADNAAPGTVSADSAPTAAVAAIPPQNGAVPMISGAAREGELLISSLGFWTGTPSIGLSRNWLRCDAAGGSCQAIPGANGDSHLLDSGDVGYSIRMRVSADNAAPGSVDADSEATPVVEPAPPVLPPPPGNDVVAGSTGSSSDTAPIVKSGKIEFRKQRGKPALWTTVRCWSAVCDVWLSATISLPGSAGVHSLFPARRHMTIGQQYTLKLAIPKSLAKSVAKAARKRKVRASAGVYAAHGSRTVTVAKKNLLYKK